MENQYNYYNPDDNQFQNNYSQGENNHQKKSKKITKVIAVIGLAIIFGIVSSGVFLSTSYIGTNILGLNKNSNSDVKTSTTAVTKSSSVVTSDVSSIVNDVMPSVVAITNMSVQEVQNFWGQTSQYQSESCGTGIIIAKTDNELLIVTNNHVIADNESLTVTFDDDTSVDADVKGTDPEHDLAVIAVPLNQVSSETMEKIAVATLGDSTALQVGEPAIAIGNAMGYGQSVTTGVISAVNRESTTTDEQTGETEETGVKLIQTDAAINPGNSGGPLVNANGEVIGINSSKLASTTVEGMGYAIPISDVSDIIDNLMNQETKHKVSEEKKGYLGVKGYDVTEESAKKYNMPTGVYVAEIVKGGGAEEAGITKGNVITALNGTTVNSMEELQKELGYYESGKTVSVTIQVPENNGEWTEKTVDVKLGKSAK
ncbi:MULTISPECIES: S1C family serine protease [Clostridia]|uniref:S1C family serine protease n=1 Tax=Clostridia TaxID=186801 RepID=UPI000EB423F2|nr:MULTISPECIES: trypsin-like peptidase domain-containing protein [Clostridia]RKQ31883.1 PDZ domain-containing protein [Ruminococcus sp. B05]TAP36124.1 trypsin-like serine protease [Mediterraneibacter sp. gm002]